MSSVRVVSARIVPGGGLLSAHAGNARVRWPERRGLILGLIDDQGRVGLGECTPLPGFAGHAGHAGHAGNAADAPDAELDACAAELDACAAELGAIDSAGWALGDAQAVDAVAAVAAIAGAMRAPAARFAVETALLDLLGQRAGLPVAELLARMSGAPVHEQVPVNALIADTAGAAAALESMGRAYARGVRCFKIKIGRPDAFDHELALLRAVRARYGQQVALRLDANRAWSVDQAVDNLARLADVAPEYVEEPLAQASELADMVNMSDRAGARALPAVALDESLAGADDAWIADMLVRGRVGALVLKPMLLGGALRCLELAALARAHGAGATVSHLFDGPVALSACAHLALVVGGTCGLDRHAGLSAWPKQQQQDPAPLVRDSHIAYDPAPGLGLGEALRGALLRTQAAP